ncbi:penicillin-binding protein 1B [Kangiella sp. TOML190]|uniref:penicillin-binding protein 1B n=1 Tax=Kangiella sp. TOML190 TaxID=2931351 RepID=UPI00203B495E|nr:penicillin-binding protein 1B [Kangiella sp. TOML190]
MTAKKSKNKAKSQKTWRQKFKSLFWKLILLASAFLFILVIYSDAQIKKQFEGKRWQLPAKVYSQPLELAEGKSLTPTRLKQELELLGYRKTVKATRPGDYEQYGDYFYIYVRPFKFWDEAFEASEVAFNLSGAKVAQLRDHVNGEPLQFARLDPLLIGQIYPNHQEDRLLVKLEQVPESLKQALLVTEDRDFYDHMGISFKGIARAVWYNLNNDGRAHGGSTITQQLVKNYFLTRERSLWRKFREAIMSVILEVRYEKDEILQAYFNEVFFGQERNRAIHGVGLASHYFFDKDISNLTPAQSALLVAILKGPSSFDPYRKPESAIKRRNLVLSLMQQAGYLTEQEYQEQIVTTLAVVKKPKLRLSKVPAFMDLVKRQLKQNYSEEELNSEGLRIFTSLDPVTQRYLEKRIDSSVSQIEKQRGIKAGSLQTAMLITEANSGKILALVGDRKEGFSGFNRALDAKRQIGSVIKPFVLAAALNKKPNMQLNSMVQDSPISLKQRDGSSWQPKNYDNKFHGNVTLFEAMTRSYNIPIIKLGQQVGLDTVADFIEQAGAKDVRALDALPLGVLELSPLELTELYQTIASGGLKIRPSAIEAVTNNKGQLLERYPINAEMVMSDIHNYLIKANLMEVAKTGTAKQLKQRIPWTQFAGKTGTTNDLKDSWFVGFSEQHLGVVWVGRDDNQSANISGSTAALPVFVDIFEGVNTESLKLGYQPEIEWQLIDLNSGKLAGDGCQRTASIPFSYGKAPTEKANCGAY